MRDILLNAALAMDISLQEKALDLFEVYYNELLSWNKKFNLISAKSELDIPIKHFIDSLTLLPYIKNTTAQVLDIGAGAGFPGIPLKIVMNSLNIFLLESSRKKTSFLKHIIRSLNLTDASVIHNRAENLMEDENYSGRFEIVTSRATLKLSPFLQMGTYFLSPGGTLIAMKGKRSDEELAEAYEMSHNFGLNYITSHDITLPITGEFRRIIIYDKVF
jgi:16S rRNA (guanine527-N7)-methyltransferase